MNAAESYAVLAMRLNDVARQMTINGLTISDAAVKTHQLALNTKVQEAKDAFAKIAGADYELTDEDPDSGEPREDAEAPPDPANLNQSARLAHLFFTTWGVKAKFFSKKTGKPSLDKNQLHDLLAGEPGKPRDAARELLKYRESAKTLQFLAKLPLFVQTTFNVCSTKTMRWSEGPYGIQRIKRPDKRPDGTMVPGLKNIFIVDRPELFFIAADKSQIDLRIMACLAGDEPLLQAFADNDSGKGIKIHKRNSLDLFGVDSGTAYDMAKIFVYSVVYDAVPETVYRQMVIKFPKITISLIKELIRKWFLAHPALLAYKQNQLDFVAKNGYTTLPLSNMRHYYYLGAAKPSEILAQRVSRTTSDDMNPATLRVARALAAIPGAQLKAQVHDELLVQGSEVEPLARMLKREMETVFSYEGRSVRLPVEVKAGKSWGDMKPVSFNGTS